MRISKPDDEPKEEIPLEVQLWLSRGWTVIETERAGLVLSGPKEMKGRTKLLIFLGVVLPALFLFHLGALWILLGAAFLVIAVLDYKFATKPPTKFFPAAGEKKRTVERG